MHAIASGLVGFASTTIRVKVLREYGDADDSIKVVTADLLDSGTYLVLSREQLRDEWDTSLVALPVHADGLIAFAG